MNSLFLWFAQHRTFWRARTLGYKLLFLIGARRFSYKYSIREKSNNNVLTIYISNISEIELMLRVTDGST